MLNIKNWILLFCLTIVSASGAMAQEKVVERSAKRAPQWIGISMEDYIITSAEKATLDEAKAKCLSDIQQAIITGVSVNISSQEDSYTRQLMKDGEEEIFTGYSSALKTIAAKLPFVRNISLADAEIYWERRLVKKEKRYYYAVHARYPFTKAQREELIAEFVAQDRAQYAKYERLNEQFKTFTSIEEIARAMNDLTPLENYFFDTRRHDEVVALKKNYAKLYDAISIVPYEDELGRHVFYFALGDRRMQTSATPVVKKQYATDVAVRPVEDGYYEITYNYDQCLDDDDNAIEVIYRIDGHAYKHRFGFDVTAGKTQVIPYGQIEIEPVEEGEEELPMVNIAMTLRSKYAEAFRVEEVNFSVSGVRERVVAAPKTEIEGKGNHTLRFATTIEARWIAGKQTMAEGYLKLRNTRSRKLAEVRFSLPCKIK